MITGKCLQLYRLLNGIQSNYRCVRLRLGLATARMIRHLSWSLHVGRLLVLFVVFASSSSCLSIDDNKRTYMKNVRQDDNLHR